MHPGVRSEECGALLRSNLVSTQVSFTAYLHAHHVSNRNVCCHWELVNHYELDRVILNVILVKVHLLLC